MSQKDGSVKVVLTAIVVNFFVTLTKAIGWAEAVIKNCPQVNEKMESKFQEMLCSGRKGLVS